MAEHGNSEGLRDPTEKELDIQLGTVEAIKDLRERVLHLETLEPAVAVVVDPTIKILDIDIGEIIVANTTVETTIYSQSIPGGTLDVDNVIHLFLEGIIQNTSGGAGNIRFKTKYGGAIMYNSNPSVPDGVTNTFEFNAYIFANGATNVQKGQYLARREGGSLGSVTGVAAIDSTVARTLEVTVELSVANALTIFTQQEAILKHYLTP